LCEQKSGGAAKGDDNGYASNKTMPTLDSGPWRLADGRCKATEQQQSSKKEYTAENVLRRTGIVDVNKECL
jgi:hypothetical protein